MVLRDLDGPVVLLDLDGVVWLSHVPIAGSVEAIARLRAAGSRVLFVTNNSSNTIAEQEHVLESIGIPATGDVLTSASAAAALIQPGERVLVAGGPGVVEAVEARGCTVVSDGPCEAVMVGFHRNFDYDGLRRAATAVHLGARLIGTNDDATYPTPDGPIPGGGAILAAVSVGSGVAPVIAGKPYEPMADLVRSMVGATAASAAVMVGDRPSTDGRFATALGCRYAQVWSGVTPFGAVVDPTPDLTSNDLSGIVDQLLHRQPA
ncbi:MAG: putative phosphatase [Ilumatobacteraceae bacterium]|nr:putative phosphatase [Ilumatobacteraceae bacterium]